MQAIKFEVTVEKDGELVLQNLPCKKDQKVEVIVLVRPETVSISSGKDQPEETQPTIWQKLAGIGKDLGLPADLAEQHDHYAHGTPKK